MMRQKLNLIGQKFGRFTVMEEREQRKYLRVFLCRCECGEETVVQMGNLRNGNSGSCGCDGRANANHKHLLYTCWTSMLKRCYSPNYQRFKDWGGRGIRVCDKWKNNFDAFYDWAIDNGWGKGLQIDRFPNNDGNYEPSNCRFTTPRKNALNRRLLRRTNTSGYSGVSWDKRRNKWESRIAIKRQPIHLGHFNDKQKALESRNNYIVKNNLEHEYKIQEWHGNEKEK